MQVAIYKYIKSMIYFLASLKAVVDMQYDSNVEGEAQVNMVRNIYLRVWQ